jgi:hypothetical protein
MRATRVLVPLMLSIAASAAQADLHYTFDDDTQGFTITSGGSLVHQVEGGNGFLQAADLDLSDLLLNVPLGGSGLDWHGYFGGTLSFDARILNGTPADWPGFGALTFGNARVSITLDIVPPTDPTSAWKTYSVVLDPLSWGVDELVVESIFSNLEYVTLNLESGDGAVEVVGIDNFRVTAAVPEPGSMALVMAGLSMVGVMGLRRHRTR